MRTTSDVTEVPSADPRPAPLPAVGEPLGPAAGSCRGRPGAVRRPRPTGRARIRVATVLAVLVLALLVAAAGRQLAAHGQLDAAKWQLFVQAPVLRYLLHALWATVEVTLVSTVLALPIGRCWRSPDRHTPASYGGRRRRASR
ncbi:hypothetical protein NKH77_53100 [Streptomyces sp. M19]